jgi:predicted lipoprotein with Yx(FWY)xxD motif
MMSGSPFRTLTPSTTGRMNSTAAWRLVRVCASAMLVATGAIHLDLYLTGYQTIPTIGWLFLLQVISAFALAFSVVVSAHRLIAAAGAGFLLSTLLGYLVALRVGLFGFREVRTSAGIVAGVIEIAGFAALASVALRPYRRSSAAVEPNRERRPLMNRRVATLAGRWVAGALTIQAAVSLSLLLSGATVPSASGGKSVMVKVAHVHGVAVLTNAHGFTLYWFAPDSSSASHCYATCAAYWPPVIGSPTAGDGVTGSLATLKRTTGAPQVTYNGHPLYTYVGDSSPGQASGNRVRLNGGWWYEMKASN